MRTNCMTVICGVLIALVFGNSSVWAAKPTAESQTPLTEIGKKIEKRYADQLESLRIELTAKLPQNDYSLHKSPIQPLADICQYRERTVDDFLGVFLNTAIVRQYTLSTS